MSSSCSCFLGGRSPPLVPESACDPNPESVSLGSGSFPLLLEFVFDLLACRGGLLFGGLLPLSGELLTESHSVLLARWPVLFPCIRSQFRRTLVVRFLLLRNQLLLCLEVLRPISELLFVPRSRGSDQCSASDSASLMESPNLGQTNA